MAKTVALLLGVHAHQPVGNFEHVLDDAQERCYGPFLRTLHEYPDFRFAIHISGWLLDSMLKKFPEDMGLLKEMVERGQAEIFGGGFTEPVLAAIPARDRIGQIAQLSQQLKTNFAEAPQGAWLTERVWESTVVPALTDSAIRYVTVDDYHFMCTGKDKAVLDGYYTTEEDGRQIDLFPISEELRYRLPFSPAAEAISYLESLADDSRQAAAIYFDDIEKFGIWPETYEWVYEKGWLREFIEGVLKSRIIKPMRYSEYHAMARTRGVVYLPSTSYIEMNEWSLPVPAAHIYADLVTQQKQENRFEITKPFVRGAIWRNFFMRYPESNWMHKRMLALSSRYYTLPENKKVPEMLVALYESQANDAYWHGLFGGLYLPHLRRAIYNAMLRLEALLDSVTLRATKVVMDVDLDGCDEVFLQNGVLQAVARLDCSGSIFEFDSYKHHHNFGDTLTRQTEHYHRRVHAGSGAAGNAAGIANPHELMSAKHEITAADLQIDGYRKSLFCDFFTTDGQTQAIQYKRPTSAKNTLDFHATLDTGEVYKKIALVGNNLVVRYDFASMPKGVFKVEINLAMPSCEGPAGRFRMGSDILGGFGQPVHINSLKHIALEDEVLGGALHVFSSVSCKLTSHPHFSVSQSEAGFEKIMQAVTLELEWSAKALANGFEIKLEVI
ncbi:MAG TPA: alpha-amylase/4-alpha-glucanotransferase domain-containing protein [Methylophilaceae bacterium]|nr:alpha-amylase/4-alpha-glucanotransferase domain-containing protein [Methylophilaceae bacterium]